MPPTKEEKTIINGVQQLGWTREDCLKWANDVVRGWGDDDAVIESLEKFDKDPDGRYTHNSFPWNMIPPKDWINTFTPTEEE